MTALIPALAGALVVAGVIGVAVGLHPTPAKAPAPTKRLARCHAAVVGVAAHPGPAARRHRRQACWSRW